MSLVKHINFLPLGDERGSLVVVESNKNVPFQIKRVYYLFATKKEVSRGFHAHKALRQVAVCVTGRCRMVLDNGFRRDDVWMESSTNGVAIEPMVWHEMHDFSSDCVLLVFASEHYDESDYIRNYKDFIKLVQS